MRLPPLPGCITVNHASQIRHAVNNDPFVEYDVRIALITLLNGLGQTERGVLGQRHASTIKLLKPHKRLNLCGFRVP